MNTLDKKEFLRDYNLSKKFDESGYTWNEMQSIYSFFCNNKKNLEVVARSFEEYLSSLFRSKKIPGLYYKYRIKDPEHLIEKIIRYSKNQDVKITCQNLFDQLNDLIGFRVIHSFKSDWIKLHELIVSLPQFTIDKSFVFTISDNYPTVFYREGDDLSWLGKYGKEIKQKKLPDSTQFVEKKPHERKYRSTHYYFISKNYQLELQVRTVFEEAWCEVDHTKIYPYKTSNAKLRALSDILNRVSGAADEIVAFMDDYCSALDERKKQDDTLKKNLRTIRAILMDSDLSENEKLSKVSNLMDDIRIARVRQTPFAKITEY